jgi:hypothetical protein
MREGWQHMRKSMALVAIFTLAQGTPAQVRNSADAYPFAPASQTLPIAPFVPAKPALPTELVLHRGRSVHEELRVYAQRAGWDLIWEAPAYMADRDTVVPGDFEAATELFLKGANEAGTRIRAVFYRGNRTVRVSEY